MFFFFFFFLLCAFFVSSSDRGAYEHSPPFPATSMISSSPVFFFLPKQFLFYSFISIHHPPFLRPISSSLLRFFSSLPSKWTKGCKHSPLAPFHHTSLPVLSVPSKCNIGNSLSIPFGYCTPPPPLGMGILDNSHRQSFFFSDAALFRHHPLPPLLAFALLPNRVNDSLCSSPHASVDPEPPSPLSAFFSFKLQASASQPSSPSLSFMHHPIPPSSV